MKIYAVIALVILLPLSCKNGSDIFAELKAGDITRLEFNDWLESRNIPVKSVYKDKDAVSDYIRQIAVEKLTAVKAADAGFDKEMSYKSIENTLHKNLLSTFFTEKRIETIPFVEPAADISIIRVYLTKGSVADPAAEESKKNLILNLISELDSGKDFNDLAGKYSEDAASKKNGHLGVVPENVMEDSIKNAIISLKENEYTKEPVLVERSLCLVKVHKRYNLTEKNIKEIVADKGNAERIIDFYKSRALDEFFKKQLKENNVMSNIETTPYKKYNEIIFSINGEGFTVGELKDVLDLFYSLRHGMHPADGFTLEEKKITSEKILKERLLAAEAKKYYMEDDAEFKRDWFYLKRATLAGVFKYNILLKNSVVTNADIHKEYIKNKKAGYYKTKKINNKEIKSISTYDEIRSVIGSRLSREKLKSLKKKWDNDILNEGSFRLVE